MYASKDAAGNPKSTAAHAKVDDAAELLTEAVGDLTQLLEKAGGDAGLISGQPILNAGWSCIKGC